MTHRFDEQLTGMQGLRETSSNAKSDVLRIMYGAYRARGLTGYSAQTP